MESMSARKRILIVRNTMGDYWQPFTGVCSAYVRIIAVSKIPRKLCDTHFAVFVYEYTNPQQEEGIRKSIQNIGEDCFFIDNFEPRYANAFSWQQALPDSGLSVENCDSALEPCPA